MGFTGGWKTLLISLSKGHDGSTGLQKLLPRCKWTLRLTYGKDGVSPLDAISYSHVTYLEG